METKIVQSFGNSGHIVLPKKYIGKRIKFITESKTFEDIKSEILEILKPYLENILGIYLHGSYARNEQTFNSDVDILVITDCKLKIIDKVGSYHIISTTLENLEETLKHNAVLILPIIKEAKTIINSKLIKEYKNYKFTGKNTKQFIDSTEKILELNKKGLKLNFEIGSLVYSLILRIRGLLIIKLLLNNEIFSKSRLFEYLKNNGLSENKIKELYLIYSSERGNIKVKESKIIENNDIKKLLAIAENLLKEVKKSLK
tara:strand:+ start:517 stop:1290 length:774 start_codon:yes stop_codon:yes gene_type:complete